MNTTTQKILIELPGVAALSSDLIVTTEMDGWETKRVYEIPGVVKFRIVGDSELFRQEIDKLEKEIDSLENEVERLEKELFALREDD